MLNSNKFNEMKRNKKEKRKQKPSNEVEKTFQPKIKSNTFFYFAIESQFLLVYNDSGISCKSSDFKS